MKTITTLVLTLLLANSAHSAVLSYTFTQGGFAEGATVTGTFTADDTDGSGQIDWFGGELTGFSLSFSGNSLLAPFTLGIGDLFTFVVDLDGSGLIGESGAGTSLEAIGASDGTFGYLAGPGPVDFCGSAAPCTFVQMFGGGVDSSTEAIVFQVVPIPAALLMLLPGLGVLFGLKRKQS